MTQPKMTKPVVHGSSVGKENQPSVVESTDQPTMLGLLGRTRGPWSAKIQTCTRRFNTIQSAIRARVVRNGGSGRRITPSITGCQ